MRPAFWGAVAFAAGLVVGPSFYPFEPGLAAQQPSPTGRAANGIEVLRLRPNFFVIAGAGGHVGVQVGEDGVPCKRNCGANGVGGHLKRTACTE